MAATRARRGEFFDSAYESPSESMPAAAARPAGRESLADLDFGDRVAVDVASPALREEVLRLVAGRALLGGGADLVPTASAIVVETAGDVTGQLSELRRRSRPDAALLVFVSDARAPDVAAAHRAGAFAVLHAPLVPEELLAHLSRALDARAAKVQAADLARKLDLDAHLASVGRITAGLSHEIANPLTAAISNTQCVRDEVEAVLAERGQTLDAVPALRDALADAAQAHQRLQGLLDAVRKLVRKDQGATLVAVDVHERLRAVCGWLSDGLRGVEVEILGGPLLARADADMLGQILLNLVSNAAHAARSLASPRIRLHAYASGDRVVASVRDNGPGISAAVQDRLFEPFYTTRRSEGGTGLGLSLCLEYAHQIGGDLSFWSLPGRGTCFRLSLAAA